jgi:hypothetical protein
MDSRELPDRKLVELCLERDEDAWAEFLRRYCRLIAGVVAKTIRRSFPPTQGMVQDLFQKTLVRICEKDFRALRELQWLHDGALRGLLQMTASTAAQDHVREALSEKRDIRKVKSLEEPGLAVPEPESFAGRVEQKILLDQLARCLQKVIQSEPDCVRDIAMFLLYFSFKVTALDLSRLYHLNVRKVENTVARLGRLARSHCL